MGDDGRKNKQAAKASVLFGRQGDEDDMKYSIIAPKPQQTSCCAPLEKWFNSMMGFPDPAERNKKKELKDLPKGLVRSFDHLPDEQKGGVEALFSSKAKESENWVNQDVVIASAFQRRENEDTARCVFGVCDGHGRLGHKVAELIKTRFPIHLAMREDLVTNTKKAFEEAMKEVDSDVYISLGADVEYSGSTAVGVMVDKISGMLHIYNVGDSRAVLGRQQWDGSYQAIPLTVDHKPDLTEEKHRIELHAGYVSAYKCNGVPEGPARVWDSVGMVKPGLACSRSIGDGAARQLGVIAKPDFKSQKISEQDKFILIASDGLWDSVTEEEAVNMVQKFINTPAAALSALTETVRRVEEGQLIDDTTIVLVQL